MQSIFTPDNPTMPHDIFNKAYYLSKSPEVRALMDMSTATDADVQARVMRAAQLATKGFTVDPDIDAFGADPFLEMEERIAVGEKWKNSLLQPQEDVQDYNNPAPPGSIKVSVDLADYPAFDKPQPAPVQTQPAGYPVGQNFGGIYIALDGALDPDGTQFTDARGTFTKHVTVSGFMRASYWTLNPPKA